MPRLTRLIREIMEKDDITAEEASEIVRDARERVELGEDPEEILLDEIGLEIGYMMDLLPH